MLVPSSGSCEMPSTNGVAGARGLSRLYASCIGDGLALAGGARRRTLQPSTVERATEEQVRGPDEVILVSDLLEALATVHPLEAQIVKLHYFGGLNISEAGQVLGVSTSTAYNRWRFARAWLHRKLNPA